MREEKRLSIAQCRKILEEGGGKYSDEQIHLIREVLYTLGRVDHLIFKQMQFPDEESSDSTEAERAA